MAGVYFDSTVFVSIFKPEKDRAAHVRDLLKELKKDRIRIHTSIIAVEECSVTSFKRGQMARDYHAKINELAEIHTVDRDIAINAAKTEAEILIKVPAAEQNKPSRKWDCFHIATARCLECSVLYSWDAGMLKRKQQIGITGIEFSEPIAKNPSLRLTAPRKRKAKAKAATAADGTADLFKE
ncbi:MAG TPA: type II toxin-antitoxin system VapC family toxin [Terriglobales bacterium]|nr:type II toxin-antitoxin system VapC family toxin [Terriglobales bacterium]